MSLASLNVKVTNIEITLFCVFGKSRYYDYNPPVGADPFREAKGFGPPEAIRTETAIKHYCSYLNKRIDFPAEI